MGRNATAILAYGYELGQAHEYDEPDPAWYRPEEGWAGSAERALLVASGFTETSEDGIDGYYTRERQARQALGVELKSHGSSDDPWELLVATKQTVDWGETKPIDLTVPDGADERLAWALDVLEIKPKTDKPAWLLAAYYG